MYLFVYKTTHVNGKYYIGRHQTENLDDDYLGSGKWVKSIKDQSTLSREIIIEATSIEELYQLEEYYIDLHWDDPLCMNYKKASVGMTSEDANNMVKMGKNPWQTRPDGTNLQTDRVKEGTHPGLKRPDGTSLTSDRVKEGTHSFLTRPDGTSVSSDRVNNGTHNFLKNKRLVPCYNKQGEYKRIPKEQYYSQTGPKEDLEWVHIGSPEGRLRKNNYLRCRAS